MPSLSRLLFLSTSVLACAPLAAQEAGTPLSAIKIVARKNPGDISYPSFLRTQRKLLSYLPLEPRKLDIMLRISFTELPMAEQDAYMPQTWGVSIVSDSVDETIQVRRGGYFVLPELPLAYQEGASVMLKEQSRRRWVDVGWVVRTDAGRLPYADFGQAMKELRAVQKEISILSYALRAEKHGKYDTLKACFLDTGGQLLIGGKPAADATVGNCALLKFDPARATGGEDIVFAGPLDIVTIVESRQYAASPGAAPAG